VRKVRLSTLKASCALLAAALMGLAGCGSSRAPGQAHNAAQTAPLSAIPQAKPQVVEPMAGAQAASTAPAQPTDPVGDPHAHAPPISQVRRELRLEVIAATPTHAGYIDPLRYVTVWERTDQGVDAVMPVGAPILAPSAVKVLAIEPGWYAGQPLVYFELLGGEYAGQVQYVAEQITDIARPGSILPQGAAIARFARSGTGIEYGLSTLSGVTMAMATTGYEEGQVTPAGRWIRAWLNSLGAHAGNR
jgi:hypothetical protein